MKINPYLFTLALSAGAIMLMSNDDGVATAQAKDRTGSPVGLTQRCEQCHSGASFTVNISNRLKDALGNVVTSYTPGETYTYEVELSSTGASKYGFQTVAIKASTNAQAGDFTSALPNTKTKSLSTGREYGEHVSPSTSGLFKLNWVAPVAGTGTVNFYASGIGCNGTGTTSGDKATLAPVLAIAENTTTSIQEFKSIDFSIYPNPSNDIVYIQYPYTGEYSLQVFSLNGKQIKNISPLNQQSAITITDLETGTYLMYLFNEAGHQVAVQKLIKL